MKAQKPVAYVWYLKEKQFYIFLHFYTFYVFYTTIYILSLFSFRHRITQDIQARSWQHKAGRKVVPMALFLLSFLCTEQSSVCIGLFLHQKAVYITDGA